MTVVNYVQPVLFQCDETHLVVDLFKNVFDKLMSNVIPVELKLTPVVEDGTTVREIGTMYFDTWSGHYDLYTELVFYYDEDSVKRFLVNEIFCENDDYRFGFKIDHEEQCFKFFFLDVVSNSYYEKDCFKMNGYHAIVDHDFLGDDYVVEFEEDLGVAEIVVFDRFDNLEVVEKLRSDNVKDIQSMIDEYSHIGYVLNSGNRYFDDYLDLKQDLVPFLESFIPMIIDNYEVCFECSYW